LRVLICGAGIAGLSLAHCLLRGGHAVTLLEKSPALRGEGYMIDFFGPGYDAAQAMGLLDGLARIHDPIPRLVFVDAGGREKFSVSYADFRRLFHGRHFNFLRGDLERLLYEQVKERAPVRFGTTIESLREAERYDLVVGADGVHSRVRALAFGEEQRFSRPLGYYTAAFILERPPGALRGDALYTMSAPGRQAGIYPIRGGRLATFFVWEAAHGRDLRRAYAGLGWVVPELLERLDPAALYFDEVTQIEMPRWSAGRTVLVGDACQCVSLAAGQGASLAMAGAFVLAQELERAPGDLAAALARYEARLRPAVERKQRAGRRIARWFVPHSRMRIVLNDLAARMAGWPLAWRLVRRALAP